MRPYAGAFFLARSPTFRPVPLVSLDNFLVLLFVNIKLIFEEQKGHMYICIHLRTSVYLIAKYSSE